jgi:hypothetical protein
VNLNNDKTIDNFFRTRRKSVSKEASVKSPWPAYRHRTSI